MGITLSSNHGLNYSTLKEQGCSSSSLVSDSVIYGRNNNNNNNNNKPMSGSMMTTTTMVDTDAATLAPAFDLQALRCSYLKGTGVFMAFKLQALRCYDLGDWCIHGVRQSTWG
eukprot:jgi/Psemu1/56828/gm1.56828_g